MTNDYKPRFSFEITEEQKQRADKFLVTYGLRKAIFGPILDDVLDMIEEYGGVAIGVMMSGKLKPRDVIPTMKRAEEVGKK
ncbi:MAG: hypothetical protein ACTSPB_05630 [Candidatus Thorarchaeota archaeon]